MPATPTALKPVYALVGPDPFLQLEVLRDILAGQAADLQRLDVDGERAQLVDVLDELRCFSMFGSGKLIVVRDGDDFVEKHREKLQEFIASLEQNPGAITGVLVLRLTSLPSNQKIHKAITKVGEVRKCDPPRPQDLPAWITKRARTAHRVEIEPAAATELAGLIGNDVGRLDSEIGKLAISATPDPGNPANPTGTTRIRQSDVRATVSFQREQEIWEITTLCARARPGQAIERWRQLLTTDPSAEFRMVTWLGIFLENCRQILDAKDRGDPMGPLAKQIRVWDDALMRDYISTATTLGREGLRTALTDLTDLDRRIKSGLADPATGVERFMASLPAR